MSTSSCPKKPLLSCQSLLHGLPVCAEFRHRIHLSAFGVPVRAWGLGSRWPLIGIPDSGISHVGSAGSSKPLLAALGYVVPALSGASPCLPTIVTYGKH